MDNWRVDISPFEVEFNSGDMFEIQVITANSSGCRFLSLSAETLRSRRDPYQFTRYGVSVETATKRPWVVNFEANFGNFYNGTRRDLEFELTLKPSHHLLLGLAAERADVIWFKGSFFTQLFALQADYNFFAQYLLGKPGSIR